MPGYARPTNSVSAKEVTVSSTGNISSGSLQDIITEIDTEKISANDINGTVQTQKIKANEWDNSSGVSIASAAVGGRLTIPDLYAAGNIVQVQMKRYETGTSVTTGSAAGVEITDLRVSITPKSANSIILCFFQVHGEGAGTHDYIYTVYKNGTKPSGTYAGYNNTAGDFAYSGIAQALPYETDYNSTPFTQHFMYFDAPGVTTPITYAPGVRDTNGTSRVFYINRTVGAPQNGYETGVSFSIAMEIGQ